MELYKELYYKLFAAMADAVEALEHMDFGTARKILLEAQRKAEEAVLSQGE